jgi:hypothetical protein
MRRCGCGAEAALETHERYATVSEGSWLK